MKGMLFQLNDKATNTEKELTGAYAIKPMKVIGECKMMVRGKEEKIYLIRSNKHFAAIQRAVEGSFKSYSEVQSTGELGDFGVNVVAAFADSVELLTDNSAASSQLEKLD